MGVEGQDLVDNDGTVVERIRVITNIVCPSCGSRSGPRGRGTGDGREGICADCGHVWEFTPEQRAEDWRAVMQVIDHMMVIHREHTRCTATTVRGERCKLQAGYCRFHDPVTADA